MFTMDSVLTYYCLY